MPEIQKQASTRILPTPNRVVRPLGNQLLCTFHLLVSWLERETLVNVKVRLPSLMQKVLVKLVEVDVFEVTSRVRGISRDQSIADVNARPLQQATNQGRSRPMHAGDDYRV